MVEMYEAERPDPGGSRDFVVTCIEEGVTDETSDGVCTATGIRKGSNREREMERQNKEGKR
jgi:hypothetical protein